MRLEYDVDKVSRKAIVERLEALGYRVLADDHHARWQDEYRELIVSAIAGALLLSGWLLGLRDDAYSISVGLLGGSILLGGYYAMRDARQSIPERRLEIDVLMIVAALGAAAWGQWTEGALLLVLFSLGAASVGISDVRAGLLPEEKLKVIDELMQAHGQVAMVGDGVNDAPAMARATIGIAMGGAGTDVALETADVALMADDLSRLPFAISLSGASHRIIRQNLWAAFGVVALLIPATLFGWASMGIAVLIHEGATVLVVLNALRLLRFADVQE